MSFSNPFLWASIGAGFGFFAAIGGQDSRIIDGVFGALLQSVIWFAVSWVIIRILKMYPLKRSKVKVEVVAGANKKLSLRKWFLITYSIPTIGALVSLWSDAGLTYGLQITFFDQLSNFSTLVFSLAGLIDVFIFPSLASAITITSSIYSYRKSSLKLKNNKNRIYVVTFYVLITIIVWIVLSLLLATLVG
jgi:hypothetical protein